jgi:hypothetical protein
MTENSKADDWKTYFHIVPIFLHWGFSKTMVDYRVDKVTARIWEEEVYTSHSYYTTRKQIRENDGRNLGRIRDYDDAWLVSAEELPENIVIAEEKLATEKKELETKIKKFIEYYRTIGRELELE